MEREYIDSKVKHFVKNYNGEDYMEGESFKDMGMESLDIIEMVIDIEDEFDVIIPDEVVEQITDERMLSEIIWKLCGSK